jgi:hypothetical protein
MEDDEEESEEEGKTKNTNLRGKGKKAEKGKKKEARELSSKPREVKAEAMDSLPDEDEEMEWEPGKQLF